MPLERTVALLKPDAAEAAPEIAQLFELAGFTVTARRQLQARAFHTAGL